MRTLEEIKTLYTENLVPKLRVLEEQRKKVAKKILIAAAIITPLSILVAMGAKHPAPLILGVIGIVFFGNWISRDYVKNFKTNIIEDIVSALDPNLKYHHSWHISAQTFMSSGLFKRKPDEFNGDDFVTGKLGDTQLDFSEIHAKSVTRDSKGNRQEHTIFKGLFLKADFNKEFKGQTVVLPDVAESMFGHVGTMFQSWNKGRGELVKLEDPEFEKMFAVYGNDQIEARYLLSTSLMHRIKEYKKKTKRKIYLSFVGSNIFIAIVYTKNLFEPRVFKTLLDFAPIQEYYDDLRVAIDVVEDLNLNTRIWTKK